MTELTVDKLTWESAKLALVGTPAPAPTTPLRSTASMASRAWSSSTCTRRE